MMHGQRNIKLMEEIKTKLPTIKLLSGFDVILTVHRR